MKKNLYIRADGNEEIGSGHIMRTMTIANEFRKNGYKCVFISSTPIKKEMYDRYQYEVIEIDNPYDVKLEKEAYDILKIINKYGKGYLLVDSYYANNDYLHILRQKTKLICINSTKEMLDTDYLINDNIACDKEYIEEVYSGTGTKLLLGAEYSPIRKEFISRNYEVRKKVRRIMVTTGGGDHYNFMTEFVRRIRHIRRFDSIHFTMVSGSYNVNYQRLLSEADKTDNITVIKNPGNMAEIMLESDLAISSGGTTIIELSVIGVPSIGISVAEDQKVGLSFMHKKGLTRFAGHIGDGDFWDILLDSLDTTIEEYNDRKILSGKCRKCFDGKGARRIFSYVTGENE